MNRQFSDRGRAFLTALGLTGAAALVLFLIRPGGFEGQIGWVFVLLPGAIAGAPISDRAYRIVPWSDQIVLWTLTLGISLLWYFVISYMAIKLWRLAISPWRSRDR
jgi:hypothetical protein